MFNKKFFLFPVLTSALVLGLFVGSSSSFASDTSMTLTVGGGGLSISAPASIVFGNVGSPSIATMLMGAVTVTDLRGVASGGTWVTSAIATALTPSTGPVIPATAIGYTSGAITKSGTITAVENDQTDLTGVVAVVTASVITGTNTASWTPTITVTVPAGLANGDYTGSVTQSVV
jgi:hypothetical protein